MLIYGSRVGSRHGVDVLDPDARPIRLRCPCCHELAGFFWRWVESGRLPPPMEVGRFRRWHPDVVA